MHPIAKVINTYTTESISSYIFAVSEIRMSHITQHRRCGHDGKDTLGDRERYSNAGIS